MNEQALELLSVDVISRINGELARVYQEAHKAGDEELKKTSKEACTILYRIGCKKAGSEKDYRVWFERS